MPGTVAAEISSSAELSALTSFGLAARASQLATLHQPEQLISLPPAPGPEMVLGGGSNTIFMADYPGRILLNRIKGFSVQSAGEEAVLVTAGAGESWHGLVRRCVDGGLHGLENLALIPGSVGAAPIQNIGAYGVELADRFHALRAFDRQLGTFVTLDGADCGFGYRDSRFKSDTPGRFIITAVTLRLSRRFRPVLHYPSLAEALQRAGLQQPDPRQLTAAVMRLRRHRLPDPARLANSGSFFKNPLVDAAQAKRLVKRWPGLPHWPMDDGRVKLGAAWMIDQLGWKGRRLGQVGVYRNHALVLVNHGQAQAHELLQLLHAIQNAVFQRFSVQIEPEPILIGLEELTA